MFPGTTTKVSEATIALATTIAPRTDVVRVTDTTSTTVVATMTPQFGGGDGGVIFLINESGNNITTVTTGNIKTAVTIGVNVAVVFIYSKYAAKWYPGALA